MVLKGGPGEKCRELGLGWQPSADHECLVAYSSFPPGSSQDGPEKDQGIGPRLLGGSFRAIGLLEGGHVS